MKIKSTLLLIFVFGGLLFNSGCKKETENLVDSVVPSISANIDGTFWKTEAIVSIKDSSGKYVITATKNNQQIVITLPTIAVGKFDIDATGNNASALYTDDISDPLKTYYAGSGTVEITAIIKDGKEFEGKFDFIALNAMATTKVVTSGNMVNVQIPK